MKIKNFTGVLFVLALLLFWNSPASAHGGATIKVEPGQIAPGGEITVTGSGLEDGELFTISLVGLFDSFDMGSVEVSEESFLLTLIVPPEVQAGLYTLEAVSGEGESLQAELTVLESAGNDHNDGDDHAEGSETGLNASAEKMSLERKRSTIEWGVAVGIILLTGLAGLGILRREG